MRHGQRQRPCGARLSSPRSSTPQDIEPYGDLAPALDSGGIICERKRTDPLGNEERGSIAVHPLDRQRLREPLLVRRHRRRSTVTGTALPLVAGLVLRDATVPARLARAAALAALTAGNGENAQARIERRRPERQQRGKCQKFHDASPLRQAANPRWESRDRSGPFRFQGWTSVAAKPAYRGRIGQTGSSISASPEIDGQPAFAPGRSARSS